MKELYRKAIDISRPKLSESIQAEDLVTYGCLSNFIADDGRIIPVLSADDQAIVAAQVAPSLKLVTLLNILQHKPDKVFDWLLQYLLTMGHTDVAHTLGCLGAESASGSKTPPPQTSSQADDRQSGVASAYNKSEKMNEDERKVVTGARYYERLAEALKGHITDILAILEAKGIFEDPTCDTIRRTESSLAQAMQIIKMLALNDRGKVGLYEALKAAGCPSLYREIFGSL